MIALWRHEISRIMRDRISRSTDLLWFDDKLDQTLAQVKMAYGLVRLFGFLSHKTSIHPVNFCIVLLLLVVCKFVFAIPPFVVTEPVACHN